VDADFAGDRIDRLPVAEHRRFLEIDDAVPAERRDQCTGLRVEFDQPEANRDVEDPLVAAVGPVADTTP
jgi:hypothetical protein